MTTQILNFINKGTNRENLEEKSTKQVAKKFGISTQEAYKLCNQLSKKGLIEKLDPVNGDKFDCCGWIRLNDDCDIEEKDIYTVRLFTVYKNEIKFKVCVNGSQARKLASDLNNK